MAVIDYKEEYVSFDYRDSWFGCDDASAVPSIEFLIHVWQRAKTLQDVTDTIKYAYAACCAAHLKRHELRNDFVSERAARWRRKGVELQRFAYVNSLADLKRLARQEAYDVGLALPPLAAHPADR